MKLTVGMACFDDFNGVFFTLQAMRLYQNVQNCEFLVIDNNPGSREGEETRLFVEAYGSKGNRGARYIAMPENTGTSQPRNRIFAEATGDAVLVLDCHVLLAPTALARLMLYYREHDGTRDLLQGPMLLDGLEAMHTHFDPVFRDEMLGIWGDDPRGFELNAEPFDISGQGLGLFSCRRDAWLGFNEHARGFGGEEMYIHEKFRRAGARCLCLPFLRWNHRFGRPAGIKYPLTRYNKVRNYVIEFNELGLPLDEPFTINSVIVKESLKSHFVQHGRMSEREWDYLVSDPIANVKPLSKMPDSGRPQPKEDAKLDEIFDWVKQTPRDLDKHADTIRDFAKKVKHVTAFVKRREWNPILLAARPETLIVYQTEKDPLLEIVHEAVRVEQESQEEGVGIDDYVTHVGSGADSLVVRRIVETDMLVIDTVMHAERLAKELAKYASKVRRFILLRGTGTFGELAEGGGPGLYHALRPFMAQNTEWHVTYKSEEQYGILVLSRLVEDPDINVGPGTELTEILALMGIVDPSSCDCRAKAGKMNEWGVEGCKLHFDEIVKWMRDGQTRWGWVEKIKAAANAVTSGLAFKLNLLDPFSSIIAEAIKRAEEKNNASVLSMSDVQSVPESRSPA